MIHSRRLGDTVGPRFVIAAASLALWLAWLLSCTVDRGTSDVSPRGPDQVLEAHGVPAVPAEKPRTKAPLEAYALSALAFSEPHAGLVVNRSRRGHDFSVSRLARPLIVAPKTSPPARCRPA